MKTKSVLAFFAIIAMIFAMWFSTTSAKWGVYNPLSTCTIDDDGDGIVNAYDSDYVRTPKLDWTWRQLRGK